MLDSDTLLWFIAVMSERCGRPWKGVARSRLVGRAADGRTGDEGRTGRMADGRFASGRIRSAPERESAARGMAARKQSGAAAKQGAALKAKNARVEAAVSAALDATIDGDTGSRLTLGRRLAFLDTLAATGNATLAARETNTKLRSAYALRSKDAVFARGWAAAKEGFNDAAYARAVEIALNGLDEEVTTRDGVRTTRRHSDKLLAQILAKHGGVAAGEAKDVVAATRAPGKAGEEARLWIEAQLAAIAAKLDGAER